MARITQQVVEVLHKFIKPVYTTDFSGYETGQPLSDWTDFWGTGDFAYTAIANSGTYKVGDKSCFYNVSTDDRSVLTWDAVGDVEDSDIVIKIGMGSVSAAAGIRIHSRVGGTAGSENTYFVDIRSSVISLNKYISGSNTELISESFDPANTTYYYVRFQTTGTTLRMKIWAEDAIEPDEWKLSTTDSDLTSGYVGFGGFYAVVDYVVDYFSCGLDSNLAVSPPVNFWNNDIFNKFGAVGEIPSSGAITNVTRAMGGPVGTVNKLLTGIKINHSGHTTDIRIAVYSGGVLSTGLNNAELLYDFGVSSSSTSPLELTATEPVLIPDDEPLWIIVKSDDTGFIINFGVDPVNSGNFQIADGRADVTAITGYDTSVAFPDPFPDTNATFSASWYDWEITVADNAVATPVILPVSGEYPASTFVTITTETSGATIYYTDSDLLLPIPGTGWTTEYTGTFAIGSERTIRAVAVKAGATDSGYTEESYTVGGALVGDTLSCDDGEWAFNPTSYSYQWKRDGSPITDETDATYLTVLADAGTSVLCTVTASNSIGNDSEDSNATSVNSA